ncbi:MAG: gliding motility lipoprotein GldH [Bacteroidota bacterium]|nr:gliding motility lipoprotein GldH [Bacteroidota bacterium]MDX5447225.1 gliding motility lipoprotein GldH [Bacteroidota bacterium]MDX5506646.1 gliding motility lipoprotein GldH [Bacteroidota bacterium]
MRRAWVLISLFLLVACGKDAYVEKYVTPGEVGWIADSIATFSFEITDTTKPYRIEVRLRHDARYPFSNLYLFRSIHSIRGKEFSDTADMILADQYGKWLGTGIGDVKTLVQPFGKGNLYFKRPGKYSIQLQHGMRQDTLRGIMDVGVALYKEDPKNNEQERS